jgi:nucleotide sugar dehydrogenase
MAVAVAAARASDGRPRFSVIGIDLPTAEGHERIERLNRGVFPFRTTDRTLIEATARAHSAGNLRASSDTSCFGEAAVILVDVNLDVHIADGVTTADFAHFRAAIRAVGDRMRPGTLVIVETTVPPGTCERIVAPELRSAFRDRGLDEDAFLLAHSYERVMPGENYLTSITNYWRVYAGCTPAAADACERFLSQVVNTHDYPLTRLASTTASETAKVMENSYRATNIAFIEEWARFAEAVGINLFDVIAAIRMRPTHTNIRQPGFGVGGYCLTKDPLFPGVAARELFHRPDLRFPFSEMAVTVNQAMPTVSIERLQTLLGGSLQGKRVLLMGVAYREDVADTRYSPAQTFIEEARRRGAEVLVHDPLVTDWPEVGLVVSPALPAADTVDAVVFAVAHRAYRALDVAAWLATARPVVLDANAVLSDAQRQAVLAAGCAFGTIGAG